MARAIRVWTGSETISPNSQVPWRNLPVGMDLPQGVRQAPRGPGTPHESVVRDAQGGDIAQGPAGSAGTCDPEDPSSSPIRPPADITVRTSGTGVVELHQTAQDEVEVLARARRPAWMRSSGREADTRAVDQHARSPARMRPGKYARSTLLPALQQVVACPSCARTSCWPNAAQDADLFLRIGQGSGGVAEEDLPRWRRR